MLVHRTGSVVASFRDYFVYDQLSYLSMVVNFARGDFASVEPFTETGRNTYPHLYYLVLGASAHLTGLGPVEAWNVVGTILQAGLVAAIAIACIRVTGRAWTGALGFVPLLLGTFAWTQGPGQWFWQMSSHAVLWGPFGVLFTLNGEAAALSVAGIAFLGGLVPFLRGSSRRARLVAMTVVAVVVGGLLNVHVYSFLATVFLSFYVVAAYAVLERPRRRLLALSAALVPVSLGLAVVVAGAVGPLPAFVVGLLPTVPGLLATIGRTRGLALIPMGAALAATLPQIVTTVLASAAGDPFLSYRVASSKDLGVDLPLGPIAGAALIVPLVVILVAGIRARRTVWTAYAGGAMLAWAITSTNDLWRANQEPYRLWIDSFLLIAVTIVPVLLDVAVRTLRAGTTDAEAAHGESTGPARAPRRTRVLVASCAALVVAVGATSALDWGRFFSAGRELRQITFAEPLDRAIAEVTAGATDGSIVAGPCLDPQIVKVDSGRSVAHYNLGMAWPADRDAVDAVRTSAADGQVDVDAARVAGVAWLVADSSCTTGPSPASDPGLTEVAAAVYDDVTGARAVLYRIGG
ncbi:putative integral membrane protein [Clavibacter sepedonicus]|uniref:Integral membrane protein n=2 Tax=Microbacteriaceae TaxID=85023 RepID=B0RDW4_CLASE|nr:putative integral membrane protein [Clavibacter sepedonicus]